MVLDFEILIGCNAQCASYFSCEVSPISISNLHLRVHNSFLLRFFILDKYVGINYFSSSYFDILLCLQDHGYWSRFFIIIRTPICKYKWPYHRNFPLVTSWDYLVRLINPVKCVLVNFDVGKREHWLCKPSLMNNFSCMHHYKWYGWSGQRKFHQSPCLYGCHASKERIIIFPKKKKEKENVFRSHLRIWELFEEIFSKCFFTIYFD